MEHGVSSLPSLVPHNPGALGAVAGGGGRGHRRAGRVERLLLDYGGRLRGGGRGGPLPLRRQRRGRHVDGAAGGCCKGEKPRKLGWVFWGKIFQENKRK